jgi:hypothetical protein
MAREKGWKFSETWAKRLVNDAKQFEQEFQRSNRPKNERRPEGERWFYVKIHDAGPDDEDDYTNENYWFQRCLLETATNGSTPAVFTTLDEDDDLSVWDTLTNEGEALDHTHKLRKGQVIIVRFDWDADGNVSYTADVVFTPIIKRGTVRSDPEVCDNFVMVQPDGTTEEEDWVLVWLKSPHRNSCPKKGFGIESIIYYIDSITPGEGEAVNPDIGGTQLRDDGEIIVETMSALNILNVHGLAGWFKDFEVTSFASEKCSALTQGEIEFNANNVEDSYRGANGDISPITTCEHIRVFDFKTFTTPTETDSKIEYDPETGAPTADGTTTYRTALTVVCDEADPIKTHIYGDTVGWPPLTVKAYEGGPCVPVTTLDLSGSFSEEDDTCDAPVRSQVTCDGPIALVDLIAKVKFVEKTIIKEGTLTATINEDCTISFDYETETIKVLDC